MVTILQKDHPTLRQTALPVAPSDIIKPEIQKVIKDMKTAMHSQDDAVAIAAPQIGELKRMFMVSGRIFDHFEEKKDGHPDLVFINPEIIKTSKDQKILTEGCLSVRYLYGKIRRASRVTIRAYDENGNALERGASGLLAQIFQHEIDHLNGILFIDKAKNIEDIPPEHDENSKKHPLYV